MKSIFKKTAAALAAAVMALSLACCGNSGADDELPEETKPPVTVTLPPKEDDPASEAAEQQTEVSELTTEEEETSPEEESVYAPAMWKVTSPDGKTMYMAGSMHALNDECYPLPEYIDSAYRQADVLAVECDISDSSSAVAVALQYSDKLTYPDGGKAKDHLNKGEWKDIASYIELHGDDPADFENYQLWYLSQQLEAYAAADAGLDATKGIDLYLLNDAHSSGKEIYEVESAEAQMAMLVNFSDEIYSVALEGYCAENNDDIRQEMQDMYEAWRTGNIENLDISKSDEDLSKDENEVMADYYQQLLFDRNVGMAQAVKDLLAEGKNVFYMVGAAHYVGDKGIVALLESDGYTVERVTE
ncbi:MAG: TraB/GumN family protein [Ruminococcus sp.]|nr:TraB/GumN family protein [Ruminococcus sp.]